MTERPAETTSNPLSEAFKDYATLYDNFKVAHKPAHQLVIVAKLTPGQRVLDVACGTGLATMAAAQAVGDNGRVIGIDIETKMLDAARRKATSAGLSNVEFRVGDAEALGFDNTSFDAVICASSIFFFNDILKALHEWRRVLKVGGTIAFTSFGARLLQPGLKLLGECLSQYDRQPPPVTSFLDRTNTPDKCRELLKRADFEQIEITTEQLGFYLPDMASYWQQMTASFVGMRLVLLSPSDLEKLKVEHLSEMESVRTDQGILIEVPTHFGVARKLL